MNWIILTGIGTYIFGWISGYANRFYSLLFLTIRIPPSAIQQVYQYVNENKKWKFNFTESFPKKKKELPLDEYSWNYCKNIPFSISLHEKYLTAGHSSKEEICSITTLRFFKKKLFDIFEEACKEVSNKNRKNIKIYLGRHSYFRQTHTLEKSKIKPPILEKTIYKNLYQIVNDFSQQKRAKSGIILHGPPGNGKTTIIKSIACMFDLDIYIPIFQSSMNNHNIIDIFSDIPSEKPAIIVLEDFDTVFNERYPEYRDCQFTFDVFLNVLDGLYCNLDNKLIFLTCNNIDKIDKALKNRPSRFDYVLKIDNPDYKARVKLLQRAGLNGEATKIAKLTDGQSAAIIAEIGKRKLNENNLDEEIKNIVETFSHEPNTPNVFSPVGTLKEISKPQFIQMPRRRGIYN